MLGTLVVPLARTLHFHHDAGRLPHPRASALYAVSTVAAGWLIVLVILLLLGHDIPSDSQVADQVTPARPEDAIAQLFVLALASSVCSSDIS